MFDVGVIGYGNRMKGIVNSLLNVGHEEVRIAAIADPRRDEMEETWKEKHEGVALFPDADAMFADVDLDGVIIGTQCNLHVEMALKVMERNLPMYLEKPVAITREGLDRLHEASKTYTSSAVVSFPLRISPVVEKALELIKRGEIGDVQQIIADCIVRYSRVFFLRYFRDYSLAGGLFMQKATHDLDYVTLLAGARPKRVSAMISQGRVFGGDMPEGLTCDVCDKREECPESPFMKYMNRGAKPPAGKKPLCVFSKDMGTPETGMNEDHSSCLIEFDNGVQAVFAQNFMVTSPKASSRGARIIGYDGTIIFNFNENQLRLVKHHLDEELVFNLGKGGKGGGKLEYDFLNIMRGKGDGIAPLADGIASAHLCLTCRDAAHEGIVKNIPILD